MTNIVKKLDNRKKFIQEKLDYCLLNIKHDTNKNKKTYPGIGPAFARLKT